MMVEKIVSGGQTGADEAGLIVGKKLGLETGGTMPNGFRTLDGNRPEFAELYGVTEHSSWAYPPRTEDNVKNSDGTVRFAANFNSPGEKCTLKFIHKHAKPYFDVDIDNPPPIQDFIDWLDINGIKVLNVAGNSERTSPGIGNFVVKFLIHALGGKNES